jgi:glycosyltransferase involved in cell wall biosynthesis
MKRILHLCNYTWESGGPPSVIFSHSKVQLEYGYEQHIYSTPVSSQTIYPLNNNQRLFIFKRSFLTRFLADFSWKLLFCFIKNRNRYEYINSHGLWNFGSILPYIIPSRSKKIVTLHGFLDEYLLKRSNYSKKLFWFIIQKWCLYKADCIHVISKNEENFIKSIFPSLIPKVVYVPNGLAVFNFDKQVNPTFKYKIDSHLTSTEIVFLYLGRLNKKKGFDLLLPAFIEFQKYNISSKLLIVGPDDGYKNELELAINENINLNANVHILDKVKDAEKEYLLKNCHIFILPSYSEGFSIAALEAIAYGIPGIYSNTIGFSEDILTYQAGLICELNIASISNQMLDLSKNKDLRKTIITNGQALFNEKYRIEIVAKRLIDKVLN